MSSTINFLTLTQTIESNFKVDSLDQSLILSQDIAINLMPYSVGQTLFLTQVIQVNCDKDLEIAHTLTLGIEEMPRVLIESVEHLLFVWQEPISESQAPLLIETLTLSQTVDQTNGKLALSELALTQTVEAEWDRVLSVEHSLPLNNGVTGHLPSRFWSSIPITVVEP